MPVWEALTRAWITTTSRIKIPEERTQALAIPVSTSNIRSIKMDMAAKQKMRKNIEIKYRKALNMSLLSVIHQILKTDLKAEPELGDG